MCREVLMWTRRRLPPLVCAAALAAGGSAWAGGSVWKDKPMHNWTAEDARQILADSPWSKTVRAGLTRRQNEDERRDSGDMGQPQGVGYDGVGEKHVRPSITDSLAHLASRPYQAPAPEFIDVQVRWETALPISTAELKAGEVEPPALEEAGYRIAVYGIPGPYLKGDPVSLGEPLKKAAVLHREGKKDIKPFRAEVFETPGGMVVVYAFPPSAEIGSSDGIVELDAQIGRVVIKRGFNVRDMMFEGKLEL
jgi:hypothetical protein